MVENKEVSSAFYKSFMYIKNNKGPKIDPCGTPTFTFAQMRTVHLKLLLAGDFSESLLKDIAVFYPVLF